MKIEISSVIFLQQLFSGYIKTQKRMTELIPTNPFVKAFRDELKIYADEHPGEVLVEEMKLHDELCLRFLKARTNDIIKASAMFMEACQYRRDHKLDAILWVPFAKSHTIHQYYIHGWHKTDKQGNPVYFDCVGKLQLPELEKTCSMEDMLFAHHHGNEFLNRVMYPRIYKTQDIKEPDMKAVPGKIMTIIDLKGLNRKLACQKLIQFITMTSKADQLLFPEMLTVCVIVNTPTIFKWIWKILQPFLEERTKKKIIMCNDSGLNILEQHIDVENIPVFLGGKCTTCTDGDCAKNSDFMENYTKYIDTVINVQNKYRHETTE